MLANNYSLTFEIGKQKQLLISIIKQATSVFEAKPMHIHWDFKS